MRIVRVDKTWDGQPIGADERVDLELSLGPDGLGLRVDAPFHGDPAPPLPVGSTPGLWNHEVVELFVAGSGATESVRYLEIELGPFGHHLVLGFRGVRQQVVVHANWSVEVQRQTTRWQAACMVPLQWLPAAPWRANAYAIHGQEQGRRYLAWEPTRGEKPDFHCPDVFRPLRLQGE